MAARRDLRREHAAGWGRKRIGSGRPCLIRGRGMLSKVCRLNGLAGLTALRPQEAFHIDFHDTLFKPCNTEVHLWHV